MKYIIIGTYRGTPKRYLANSIHDNLYIHVAGRWRFALWNEFRNGFSCLLEDRRPYYRYPWVFIPLIEMYRVGRGIWKVQKRGYGYARTKTVGWRREEAVFTELKREISRQHLTDDIEVTRLMGGLRRYGVGDIRLKTSDHSFYIDVKGSYTLNNEFVLITDKMGVGEFVKNVKANGGFPVYAFILNSDDQVPKEYNYFFLVGIGYNEMCLTFRGEPKRSKLFFSKSAFSHDVYGRYPSTTIEWMRGSPYFLTCRKFLEIIKPKSRPIRY